MTKIEEARGTIEQCDQRLSKIGAAQHQLGCEKAEAESRLFKLKERRPPLLARVALGEASPNEVVEVKKQIAETKDLLEDIPLALKQLGRLEIPLRRDHGRAEETLDRQVKYEELKKEATKLAPLRRESFSAIDEFTEAARSLSGLAVRLDCQADCSAFLAGFEK